MSRRRELDSLGRYNIRGAARRLGVHENTVRNMTNDGRLRAELLASGFRRIPASEVERVRLALRAASARDQADPGVGPGPARSRA